MAKSSRGGKRTASASTSSTVASTLSGSQNATQMNAAQAQQIQQDIQQDIQQNNVQNNVAYAQFMAMNDDGKAQVISDMIGQDVPVHLADNSLQRFIYNMGLDEKPTLVDDDVLDGLSGQELFRTVNYLPDSYSDSGKGYTAPQIAAQFLKGTNTRVSDNGGSVHGRGFYFDESYSGSTNYGRYSNLKSTSVMRGKLNSNAKVISESRIDSMLYSEVRSGSKLGKILSKCDYDSRTAILAISKGYNVIRASNGYNVVLNRGALTMSKDIKAMDYKWK